MDKHLHAKWMYVFMAQFTIFCWFIMQHILQNIVGKVFQFLCIGFTNDPDQWHALYVFQIKSLFLTF